MAVFTVKLIKENDKKTVFVLKPTQNHQSMNWIALENIEQIEVLKQHSVEFPVLLFKHSTRCSVSRTALRIFEKSWDFNEKIETYLLDLLSYRAVSNEVAQEFDIEHQSPQVLVIKNGKCIYTASHESINAETIIGFLNTYIKP